MNNAKNHTSSTSSGQNDMKMPPSMNESGEMQEGQEPPEKPDGENNSSNEQKEKPSDENNSSNDQQNTSSSDKTEQSNTNNAPDKNESMPNNIMRDDSSNDLKTIYYVLFGIESLILSGIIIYLIMSRLNKKTIKETFSNKDKVLIYVLSIIILTSCFTYIDGKITKDYLLKDKNIKIDNSNESNVTYSSSTEIKEDTKITSGKYSSSKENENVILVSGNNTTLSNIEVNKTGDSSAGDNTSFYGTNSAIVAKDGANLILKNITVNTNATGSNGVFSYGGSATTNNSSSDNTKITISDSTITTTKDNSGGIMTTGGGIMKASNLTINTSGTSSAAIRTDRGGGTVTVDGGTYTTLGKGSPAIYSTANVSVSNSKLISKASEGIVIEGKNSVTIDNCNLTDSNTKLNGQSTTYKNIFLYQSMSGDAADGNAEFTSTNSTITTNNGDSFYVTNTTATINLENNTIVNNDTNGNFLRVQKDSWGKTGENGGDVTLVMTKQKAQGNIVIDSISTLDMTMKSNSYYEGTINGDNSAKTINLSLDKTSKIKLTGDSYITSLDNKDMANSNIDFNGYKLYVNGQAIN